MMICLAILGVALLMSAAALAIVGGIYTFGELGPPS